MVAAALIAVGAVLMVPEHRDLEVTANSKVWYVLLNRHSGKALTDRDRGISDGSTVTQWARDDAPWQLWQFTPSGGGYYRLRNQHSNMMLADANNAFVDGTKVAQGRDHDGVEEDWRMARSSGGYVRLVNSVSGKALEVPDASHANGADVDQQADVGAENQQWRLVAVGSADYPGSERLSGDLTAHDPDVIRLPGRRGYLLAGTGTGIGLKTSPDRVHWTDVGEAFPHGAPWAHTYTDPDNQDLLWAPDLSHHDGRYYLYYAASRQGSFHSGIFLATSSTGGAGSWTNHGMVVDSQESGNVNAIDPNLVVDDQGRWWLAFGSYGSGIKMVQLDPATGRRLDTNMISIANRSDGSTDRFYGPEEAAFVFKHGSYYYLYMSFDHCCAGASSDYRVVVARSMSATGPYVDKAGLSALNGGGTEILAGHGSIRGPGHQAVLADSDGDILFYHYYAESDVGGPACGYCTLGINRIGYDNLGWPVVH